MSKVSTLNCESIMDYLIPRDFNSVRFVWQDV